MNTNEWPSQPLDHNSFFSPPNLQLSCVQKSLKICRRIFCSILGPQSKSIDLTSLTILNGKRSRRTAISIELGYFAG